MKKHKKNQMSGITLIALVVTIIVLLILAGISIQMLSGNNGILKRTGEAKELTEVGQEKEKISLAYNSVLIDKKQEDNNNITVDDLDKAIKSYDVRASVTSEREKLVVTFSNGNKYSIYNSGKITEYTTKPYAVDELTVKVSGNTVESPYYVNYPSAKGTIKCRVLYNDSTYGLQIVSVNPITKVLLGKEDPNSNVMGTMGTPERALNSYNRAVTTLNEATEEYIETNDGSLLAIDARCIGSNPLNKNYPDNLTGEKRIAEMYISDQEYLQSYNGKFFKLRSIEQTDALRLNRMGAMVFSDTSFGNYYFWANHYIFTWQDTTYFGIQHVSKEGIFNNWGLWSVKSDGTEKFSNDNRGLRPVFILSPNVKILSGEGTEEVPFEIGL